MEEVKLKEEQELWEPAEVENTAVLQLKQEPDCGGVQSHEEAGPTTVHVKEEPEEVKIQQETNPECPFIRVIVKNEDEDEEESLCETVKEANREDRDGEGSSDTDDSGDWTPSLSLHPETHTEQLQEPAHAAKSPFSCSVCAKEFTYRSGLMIHMRSHTDDRPFRCSVCSKSFKSKGHLAIHVGIHTGAKPFRCSVCAKEYAYRCDLKKHLRTHAEGKPFRCSVCKMSFQQCREKPRKRSKPVTLDTCPKCSSQLKDANQFCPIRPKPIQSGPPQATASPGPVQTPLNLVQILLDPAKGTAVLLTDGGGGQ